MTTSVGIREFRAGLAEYIDAAEPVAVTRHGITVGWFIPTPVDHAAQTASLRSAATTLNTMLAEQGIDTEELVAEFATRRRNK